jgi:hypothetical protein
VDGLFDDVTIGYSCDPQSIPDIADGLRLLLAQESRLKGEIRRLQEADAFNHLRRAGITARYKELLEAALAPAPKSVPHPVTPPEAIPAEEAPQATASAA